MFLVVRACEQVKAWNYFSRKGGLLHIPERVFCCFHFTETCLMRLEEQPVHVGQFHFIVVKQEQLQRHKERD